MTDKKEFEIGRQPDYKLSALNKDTEHKGNIGCAWINANGTISIKLNPFVVLSASQNLAITLFPNDDRKPRPKNVD